MGPEKLIIILLIVLVLFGAKRIPEIAGSMGKGVREFKKSFADVDQAVRAPLSAEPLPPEPAPRAPDPGLRDEARPEPKRLLG